MHPPRHLRTVCVAALYCCALLTMGCRGLAVPAIDPTGESIFTGGTTTVAPEPCPLLHHRGTPAMTVSAPLAQPPCAPPPLVAVPAPVVVPVVPIAPPACAPPVAPPVAAAPACKYPELKITPSRIVAPVCSEVIVAAGICGTDGYFITRQPIEWMLAQDGVGQIVQVGKESPRYASYLLRQSPDKVATNYVRAHTSTIAQTIDRGTKAAADDVALDKGQSWISVTSPTEGTSHVTVWAPDEHNWPNRKKTATIYWVDARWTFPPPATVRSGKHLLSTSIVRSAGAPVSGWIVRYEVLDGPAASFANRQQALEVRTDAAGVATVELLANEVTPGITRIGVQIIRPDSGRGDQPTMIVGQAVTNITWTTPGLQVLAEGPSSVALGGILSYRVQVQNNGDLPTRGVTLSFAPPTGLTFLNSNLPAQPFGTTLKWHVGGLPGRASATFTINCRADRSADIVSRFVATSSTMLTAQADVRTRVFAPALKVNMSGPSTAPVGGEAKFLIEVINTGSTALTNVTVTDNFDPGLAQIDRELSPITKSLGTLAPGEAKRLSVTFIVLQAGQHWHRLDVTADGNHSASSRGSVTGLAASQAVPPPVGPPPAAARASLSVRISGPRIKTVGETAEYIIEVTNTGNSPAANVRIAAVPGVNLRPTDSTRGLLAWQVPIMSAGAVESRQVNCECLNADERATLGASVVSNETASQATEFVTQIVPRQGAGAAPPVAGDLKLTIAPVSNPIQVGRNTTFQITLTNQRAAADQDVTLTIALPEGLQFVKMASPYAEPALRAGDRTLQLTPINTMRPGEEITYRLEVTGARPGLQRVEVQVQSASSITGFKQQGEVTVN